MALTSHLTELQIMAAQPNCVLLQVGKKGTAEDVAEALAAKAQEAGSTDDVTVVALKLG